MPSKSALIIALAGLAFVAVPMKDAAAEKIQYKFTTKKDAKAFDKIRGKWIVADGAYSATIGPLASRRAVTITKARFADFTAKVKFRMDRAPSDDPAASFQAAIYFRGAHDADGLYRGYIVNMEILGEGEVRLRLSRANPYALLCNDLNVPVDDAQGWHTVDIEAVGRKLELSFRGQSLCKVQDDTFRKGGIGFATSYQKDFDPGGTFSIDTLTIRTSGKQK